VNGGLEETPEADARKKKERRDDEKCFRSSNATLRPI